MLMWPGKELFIFLNYTLQIQDPGQKPVDYMIVPTGISKRFFQANYSEQWMEARSEREVTNTVEICL